MSDEKKAAGPLAYLKDISSLLRDAIVTIIAAVRLIHPASIKTFLKEGGLSKLGVFGVTVELQEEKEKIAEAQKEVTTKIIAAASTAHDAAPPEALKSQWIKSLSKPFLQQSLGVMRFLTGGT